MNILLVEDSFVIRQTEKEALEELNIENIVEASDGDEAVELLRKGNVDFDLILCDVRMPVMDGEEFLNYVKNSEKFLNIPVIMCTSVSDKEEVIRLLKAGAEDYILKPFDAENLKLRIQRFMDKKENPA